jgi:hypothetical protein
LLALCRILDEPGEFDEQPCLDVGLGRGREPGLGCVAGRRALPQPGQRTCFEQPQRSSVGPGWQRGGEQVEAPLVFLDGLELNEQVKRGARCSSLGDLLCQPAVASTLIPAGRERFGPAVGFEGLGPTMQMHQRLPAHVVWLGIVRIASGRLLEAR